MALHLFRRHRRDCKGSHPEDFRSGEFEEHKKGWRRCVCPIIASGTLAGKFARENTATSDWTDARRFAHAREQANSWTPEASPAAPSETLASESLPSASSPRGLSAAAQAAPIAHPSLARTTIREACAVFYMNRESRDLAEATLSKYRTFTKQLTAFAENKGYVMVDQFTHADIDVFWATWKLGKRTKAKRLTTLRGFFRFCAHRKWIPESPVSPDIKPAKGATKEANKVPFTDEELADILKACDQLEDQRWGNRWGSGVWTGEDVKDFIWTLTYTGLRISDAAFFDINRLHGNEVFLHAKKNGGDVFMYIPDWLCERLRSRAKRFGRCLFLTGRSRRLETVTDIWRQRLARVFALADVGEDPATPHRFRHTFARILLQKGVSVADVADLLGDDEKTVREHYARWVPERQARLTGILKAAFADKPKLTAIQGGRL